jgi:hypothetical protein
MKICEDFGFTYEYWESLPYKEKLRYLYYEKMKAMKEEHELEKAKKQSYQSKAR